MSHGSIIGSGGGFQLSQKSPVLFGVKSLVKGFVASFVQFIGLIIGGMVAAFLGLTAPALPVEIDQTLLMPLFMIVGVCVSVPLGELFRQLNQGFTERFLCIFLFNFMVQHILQILEQIYSPLLSIRFIMG